MQNILHRLAELSRIDWVLLPQLALASYALRVAARIMSLPQFESHAWITHDGEAVPDAPDLLRRFTSLQRF